MIYVLAEDVLNNFIRYMKDYDDGMISIDSAIEELEDAIDNARYEEIFSKINQHLARIERD